MALPPDPIEEVLSAAAAVIMAKVVRVISQEPQQPFPKRDPKVVGGETVPLARQVVALEVLEVVKGEGIEAGQSLEVIKPEGEFTLIAAVEGPFLLAEVEGGFEILGRYGPDTYRRNEIEAAL